MADEKGGGSEGFTPSGGGGGGSEGFGAAQRLAAINGRDDRADAEAAPDAQRVRELEARVDELERTLAAAREAIDAAERRHQIDLALIEADAADLETARLLVEAAVAQMDEADVALAVGDLRRRKPFLFREHAGSIASGAMAPRREPRVGVNSAVIEAARGGSRAALLRYLRARREGE